jgi:hypothetical protein
MAAKVRSGAGWLARWQYQSSGKERQMKGGKHQHHKRDATTQVLDEHGATGFALQG